MILCKLDTLVKDGFVFFLETFYYQQRSIYSDRSGQVWSFVDLLFVAQLNHNNSNNSQNNGSRELLLSAVTFIVSVRHSKSFGSIFLNICYFLSYKSKIKISASLSTILFVCSRGAVGLGSHLFQVITSLIVCESLIVVGSDLTVTL